MKYSVITLGCKVNSCESAAIAESFEREGFTRAAEGEAADVYVVNSCCVTSMAEKKVRQAVSRCKKENPECVTVLCGCFPQSYPEAARTVAGADIVTGNAEKSGICEMVKRYLANRVRIISEKPMSRVFDEDSSGADTDRTRVFIKVEDGCDRFCSYCIIPFARGRVRSRRLEDISRQALLCVERGHKEIVLTGINLGCYGQEMGLTLGDAVKAAEVAGVERIRLSSLEPEMITDSEIEKFKSSDKLCPHFHLALQSGCDETLRRMNRRYDTEMYREVAEKLRSAFPDCAITTDIMVGFAGETDEEFQESLKFAEEMRFAKIHVFPYSIRKGTIAAEQSDQVVPQIKSERAARMIRLGEELERRFLDKQIGSVQTVLIEKRKSEQYSHGFSGSYVPVRIYGEKLERHLLVKVEITSAREGYCLGRII